MILVYVGETKEFSDMEILSSDVEYEEKRGDFTTESTETEGEGRRDLLLAMWALPSHEFGGDLGAGEGSTEELSRVNLGWEDVALGFLEGGNLISARRRKMLPSISHWEASLLAPFWDCSSKWAI